MRNLCIAVAIIFIIGVSGMAAAQEAKKPAGAPEQGGAAQEKKAAVKGEKEIVVNHRGERSDDKEFGENDEREMPSYETYDENTGLPNVVPSDSNGEI